MQLDNASSEYATIADNASVSVTGDITIEFWIKMTETLSSGQFRALVLKSSLGASNRSYETLYGNVGGTPRLFFYIFPANNVTNFFEGYINKTLTSGTWFHVAVTCDVSAAAASKLQWYFDGVSAGSGTGTNTGTGATSIYDSTAAFRIGQADPVTANYYPDAQFSLVRLWSTIRSGTDITDNICEVLGSTADLRGEWTLDNTYNDNSGNSNTLSGVNTPTFVSDVPSTCGVATNIKTYDGVLTANVKTVLNGTAIANRKTWNGIT
jgi:hypothetical protein